ncbi:MAG: apolipoprotein N-acyltransferase [Candidatus Rokuibacteriota bacterium]
MNAETVRRAPGWLLAVLSGVFLSLSFPGSGDQGWLAFVALVPLLVALQDAGWRRAGELGFVAGIVFWLTSIPWVAQTMVSYGGLAWPLAALVLAGFAAYLALYWAVFCALLSRISLGSGGLFVVVSASLWVSLEFLRTYLFTGFPWNLLSYSQWRNVPLIQVAAVTGVYGVSFVVVAVNAALWRALERGQDWRQGVAALGAAALIVALALASGWLPPRDVASPSVRIALAQGSIEQGVKWEPAYQDATLEVYRDLTVEAAGRGARVVVWPETAVPFFLQEDPRRLQVERLARETGIYLLVGAPDRTSGRPRNSAFLVGPDGRFLGRYDKRHLVPFGEYVPLKPLLGFVDVLGGGAIGDFAPGRQTTLLETPAGRLAVVICYEAIFPSEVRDFFLAGADVLVNITNDAWFGRSAAPVQHLAMAAFRAVENRAYLVRAANSGISAIVAPDGRIEQTSGLFRREVLSGLVAPRAGASLYTRHGDLFAWATVAVVLAALSPVALNVRRRTRVWGLDRGGFPFKQQDGSFRSRRGLLASLVGAVAAVTAATAWLFRPQLADGRGYLELVRWRIPGGEGRFIAVGPSPSAEELRVLGERLRDESRRMKNAVVMVFDDAEAAREVRKGSRAIGEERFQAALRHQRAMYVKQPARGEERLVIYATYPAAHEVIRY